MNSKQLRTIVIIIFFLLDLFNVNWMLLYTILPVPKLMLLLWFPSLNFTRSYACFPLSLPSFFFLFVPGSLVFLNVPFCCHLIQTICCSYCVIICNQENIQEIFLCYFFNKNKKKKKEFYIDTFFLFVFLFFKFVLSFNSCLFVRKPF